MNRNGQALIETAVFSLMFSGLMVCLLGFTQWFTVRQKILLATREAALLYSSGRMEPEEVRTLVSRYLAAGSPALTDKNLRIAIGQDNGPQAKFFDLDKVTVRYTIQSNWIQALHLDPTMEETCIIKHAPHYGPPFQRLWGPQISY
jgi:Flp pilus assembly protein TadG